jgi:hypothetical protein
VNRRICSVLILSATLASAQGQKLTGVITDSMCPTGDHSQMQMGPDDAECTKACVEIHGASYMLYDGKQAYYLSDQKTPERFAGKKVVVIGSLDAAKKTIHVEMIALAGSNH